MFAFNHDGFSLLQYLADSDRSEEAAAELLIRPLADTRISLVDWSICSTGVHNCRTRHRLGLTREWMEREASLNPRLWGDRADELFRVGDVVAHYNRQPQDLLDIAVKHGRAAGLLVFAGVRLNHGNGAAWLEGVPGAPHDHGMRRDFRDPAFQEYLVEVFQDLLAKDVDGLTLDFERKAPFFPPEAPADQRLAAATRFLRRLRELTPNPLLVGVSHEPEKGRPQGQDADAWLEEGLIDILVPATHNHEPDALDWSCERWLTVARQSPRRCRVLPQIWPTAAPWNGGKHPRHSPAAIQDRIERLLSEGADGVYLFNFCCYGPLEREFLPR